MASPFSSAMEEERYDVFLSFRGEDTRYGFATYIYQALRDKKVLTFMDDSLNRGDEIVSTPGKAIQESKISVVIFSENYAASTWCLDELVNILECKERIGQIVIPIFYEIDPSIVRKQEKSYGVAFSKLEERFKDRMDKVDEWRAALTQASNLCGLNSKDFRSEYQLVQKIVEEVSSKLCESSETYGENCEGMFGIQERMEKIENLLDIECPTGVGIVGIWGMGHWQQYKTYGPNNLRKQVLTQLFNDEVALISMDTPSIGSPFIQNRLHRKKILIVLDDVDNILQFYDLVEGYHQLGPGSRVMITSRNKEVLVKVADEIYEVERLTDIESPKLFHWHAFGRNSYLGEYHETLSKMVASYAYGNPLALKVLGSFLHSRSEEEWKSALEKLKRVPNKELLEVLRISYEGLDDEGIKNIFLDIACFFDKPFTREYAESILDGGDSYSKIGISVLIDKSLLEVSREEKYFRMHDLIRQMGWSVVSDEHKEPGNCSRLCNANDVCHVLEKNTGAASIEGILLNISEMKRDVKMSPAAFSKMRNLWFLKIYCDNIDRKKFKLCIPCGLESWVSNELRYFQWDFYPLESLPSDFTPENLIQLILRHSHLKQLENYVVKSLPKLKKMDLSNSKLLTRIADLSQAPNLESINLEGCTSLFHVLSSLQNLHKLAHLNLSGCNKLRELAEVSGRRGHLDVAQNLSKNICNLNFTLLNRFITGLVTNFALYSSSLNISRNFPMNLTSLNLSKSTIEVLPSSVYCLAHLRTLDLVCCKKLKSLSTSICKLKTLQKMNLDGCSNLEEFPEILEPMEDLTEIVLDRTAIKKLPQSIENLIGLTYLSMRGCKDIEYLPKSLCGLNRLYYLKLTGCSKLQKLPPCPLGLKYLNVSNCEGLKLIEEVPPILIHFDAAQCTSLETISSQTNKSYLMVEVFLMLKNCSKLDQNTQNFVANSAIFSVLNAMFDVPTSFPYRALLPSAHHICYPGDEIPNEYTYQSMGSSMNINLPLNWNSNDLLDCACCIVFDWSKADDRNVVTLFQITSLFFRLK